MFFRVTKTVDLSSEEAKNVKRDEGIKKNEATTLLKPVGISGWVLQTIMLNFYLSIDPLDFSY